jgi:hypothetical protein
MTSSINAPAAQFHPADPPEPEKDDDPTCPRCREPICCCAYLPGDWHRDYAHPSYLAYARRRAAQEREALT